jgi:nitric oxide dioxygenase
MREREWHAACSYPVMTPDDIRLVQESWSKIEPVKQLAAALFYTRLFELDPPLRKVCGEDLAASYQRFTQVVSATVRGLARVEMLLPAVREFGLRHPLPGETEQHHANVASALLWMLDKALRRDFTPEVKSAWIKAYGVLSQTVREAGAPQAA